MSKFSIVKDLLDLDDSFMIEDNPEDTIEGQLEIARKVDTLSLQKNRKEKVKPLSSLKINVPIKEEEDCLEVHNFLPAIPFSILNCGARFSGKSVLTLNFLDIYKDYFDEIIVFSPTIELDYKWKQYFEKNNLKFEPHENIFYTYDEDTLIKILNKIKQKNKNKPFKDKLRVLMIMDDIITMIPKNQRKTIFNRLILNNRHYNVSVIINSQSYHLFDSNFRKNVNVCCLFATDNLSELRNYVDELSGVLGNTRKECIDNFVKLYKHATKDKHNFLYLNYGGKHRFYKNLDVPLRIGENGEIQECKCGINKSPFGCHQKQEK